MFEELMPPPFHMQFRQIYALQKVFPEYSPFKYTIELARARCSSAMSYDDVIFDFHFRYISEINEVANSKKNMFLRLFLAFVVEIEK